MKKFFTYVPLQPPGGLKQYVYAPVGNEKLRLEQTISFPILTAIYGYSEENEEIQVVVIQEDTENCKRNYATFRKELESVCARKNLHVDVVDMMIPSEQNVATHSKTFVELIDQVQDGDELFVCITYGTKPQSVALRMAVQYAYRVKNNVSIPCMVYGNILRPDGECDQWRAQVCDETALVRLDEIVRILADRRVEDPRTVLSTILEM